jgi:peptidoglycan/xylan/chitin deacetylase (PgdA/CDA1 family)
MNGRTVRWLLSLAPRRALPRGPRLTVVRHHRVYAEGETPLYRLGVSERVLEAHLAMLGAAGLVPLTVGEGLARLASERGGHWVAFSFDDGYVDNVERALPLLQRAGARATFYLTAGLMDERLPAWWDELAYALVQARIANLEWPGAAGARRFEITSPAGRRRALQALLPEFRLEPALRAAALARLRDATGAPGGAPCEFATWEAAARLAEAGMEIGAHTLSHPHLALLSPGAQKSEILGSIDLVERRLGTRPTGFAYPGGDFDEFSVATVRGSGLAHAVTTRTGDVAAGADRFTLRRRGLSEGACLGPGGRFSRRLALAELRGDFDALRGTAESAETAA